MYMKGRMNSEYNYDVGLAKNEGSLKFSSYKKKVKIPITKNLI